MNCPQCGTAQPDDAVICSSCDNILDASFLDEADAPALDDDGTDPGSVGTAAYEEDEGTDPGSSPPSSRPVTAAAASAPRGAASAAGAAAAATTAAAASEPDPYDVASYNAYKEQARSRPAPQARPAAKPAPAAAPKNGGLRTALEFDTSSQMMDDYEKLASELWLRFKALGLGEKLLLGGTVAALLTLGMPWSITVSPAGTEDANPGIGAGGWLTLLLVFAVFGLSWFRLMRRPRRPRLLILAQMSTAGLGILWAVVCLGLAAAVEPPISNPHGIDPGPSWGLYANILAWGFAAFGGLMGLKGAEPEPQD